jgi:hypothetical protein
MNSFLIPAGGPQYQKSQRRIAQGKNRHTSRNFFKAGERPGKSSLKTGLAPAAGEEQIVRSLSLSDQPERKQTRKEGGPKNHPVIAREPA